MLQKLVLVKGKKKTTNFSCYRVIILHLQNGIKHTFQKIDLTEGEISIDKIVMNLYTNSVKKCDSYNDALVTLIP